MGRKVFAFLTLVIAYLLIVFGGYVSSSESGMGCGPDWPLCNGVIVPVLQGATLVEYAHRVIGAVLAGMTVILFIYVYKQPDRTIRAVAFWMMGLMIVQVLLGAVVVIFDLPAVVVSIHLVIAIAFFCCILWIWRFFSWRWTSINNRTKHPAMFHLTFLLFLLALTFALGAYVKHEHYGLACSWLDCRDTLFPTHRSQLWQTLHRLIAAVVGGYVIVLAFLSRKWETPIKMRLFFSGVVVATQLAIGVWTIVTSIAIPWAVLHLAVATLLVALLFDTWLYIKTS